MRARNPGRYLAAAALVAVIVAVVVVINNGLSPTHRVAPPPSSAGVAVTHRAVPRKRFYIIRSGDTLSSIALKTGVPVSTLSSLNPNATANQSALQVGGRLRLRP
jgi:Tfp pilus assembly protein FimV